MLLLLLLLLLLLFVLLYYADDSPPLIAQMWHPNGQDEYWEGQYTIDHTNKQFDVANSAAVFTDASAERRAVPHFGHAAWAVSAVAFLTRTDLSFI